MDGLICNTRRPGAKILNKYAKEKAEFVELGKVEEWIGSRELYSGDLMDTSENIVRHDSAKLASRIRNIVFNKA